MQARAMQLYALVACSALARADRHVLVMPHSLDDTGPLLEPTAGESLMATAHSAERTRTSNLTQDENAAESAFFADSTVPAERSPTNLSQDENLAESAFFADQAEPAEEEGSLEYTALDNWRTEAAGQVDGVVAEERDELDPAATEGLSAAATYAEMLSGLGKGFDTLRAAVGDFRAANKGRQGRQNEDVREVLRSARVESGATADATETPVDAGVATGKPLDKAVEHEVDSEEEVVPQEPHANPLSESVVGSGTATNVTARPDESGVATGKPLDDAVEREEEVVPQEPHANPLSESVVGSGTTSNGSVVGSGTTANATEKVVEDVSHEAEKLTGHAENEAIEEDAVESGSVVRKETSKQAEKAVGDLEKSLESGEFTGDAHAAEQAVKNLVEEETAQQARVTTACFALSDSPLKSSDRKCNSEVVKGIFNESVCEGHGGNLKEVCDATSKCQTKHVCVKDGEVITDSDGHWEVSDGPSCETGEPETVCVPKEGGFRLPAAP